MLRIYTTTTNAVAGVTAGVGKFVSGHVAKIREDESGATAIEYGLIAAGIAVAIIGIVFALGNDIAAFFQAVDTQLTARTPT